MGTSRISYPEPASALSAENRTKDIIIFFKSSGSYLKKILLNIQLVNNHHSPTSITTTTCNYNCMQFSRSSPLGVNGHAGSVQAEFQQKLSHYDSTLLYSTQLETEKQDKQKNGNSKEMPKQVLLRQKNSGKTRSDASGKWKRCLPNSIHNGTVPSPAAFTGRLQIQYANFEQTYGAPILSFTDSALRFTFPPYSVSPNLVRPYLSYLSANYAPICKPT